MQMSLTKPWEVELFSEEEEFVGEVYNRRMNQNDGRGEFIAPVKGPIIYLDQYEGLTESAIKFMLLCVLNRKTYKQSGVKGMKFMNFTYQGTVPKVRVDSRAKDLWDVDRTTTDGQPLSDITGLPIDNVLRVVKTRTYYNWDADKGEYVENAVSEVPEGEYYNQTFFAPSKLVENN